MRARYGLLCRQLVIAILALLLTAAGMSGHAADAPESDARRTVQRIFVFDGSGVHDIGELLLHTGNWGVFGSYPNSNLPFSDFPSAEWPAYSGIEHLYVAGLWVGAKKNGIPCVSTSAFQMEFRPTDDPIDRFYNAYERAPGGSRLPSSRADDDGDGLLDEDWLDGHDNDEDGMIDEDFAAISDQMFSSWFTDDQPDATRIYPEHEPLHLLVRQETYQWEDERFDDFVGVTFTITNTGTDLLEDVYLGIFADGDIGRRSTPRYWMDDAAGAWRGIRCTAYGSAYVDIAYLYDADRDGGLTLSFFGASILGHLVDPLGELAPRSRGMTSFKIFSGNQPYENGGDPVNDFQRYEVMSRRQIDRNQESPGDYRVLASTGPFAELAPGQSIVFHVGLVAGSGIMGLVEHAARCQIFFDGLWFDIDGDPMTGVDRRETPVYGPAQGVVRDACRPELSNPIDVPPREIVWINSDCEREDDFKRHCGYDEADSIIFRTGVDGRETQIHWLHEMPPMELVALDIRPGSCPNPFNVKLFEFVSGWNTKKGGVLPVALLGGEELDVHRVDISTVRLEGVAPLPGRSAFGDVSSPPDDRICGACVAGSPDGNLDLVLKFSCQSIAAALLAGGSPSPGESRMLELSGELDDGTAFWTADCVRFVGNAPGADDSGRKRLRTTAPRLLSASPNPFNPVTAIAYELGAPSHVTIDIYDVSGRLVRRLVDERRDAGRHKALWDGRDHAGRSAASGVYFCAMRSGHFTEVRKMLLLR